MGIMDDWEIALAEVRRLRSEGSYEEALRLARKHLNNNRSLVPLALEILEIRRILDEGAFDDEVLNAAATVLIWGIEEEEDDEEHQRERLRGVLNDTELERVIRSIIDNGEAWLEACPREALALMNLANFFRRNGRYDLYEYVGNGLIEQYPNEFRWEGGLLRHTPM